MCHVGLGVPQALLGSLPRQHATLRTVVSLAAPLSCSRALRPSPGGGAGLGAAGAVPTTATAPLPALPPAPAPQNILATPASLFSVAAKASPHPSLPSACQAPPPLQNSGAWPDLVSRCPYIPTGAGAPISGPNPTGIQLGLGTFAGSSLLSCCPGGRRRPGPAVD